MEYFKIGKIVATHGVDGKMVIRHSLGKKCDFKDSEAVFMEPAPGSFIPWFVNDAKAINDQETLLSLEGINSRESARPYIQKEIWLAEDDFKNWVADTAPISLLGFEIIENNQSLGTISEVIEQPYQVLCKILLNEKEAWIPIHKETLKKIDQAKKQVTVVLPDGLLDVFLDS